MSETILDVRDVGIRFGGVVAVDGVSFSVKRSLVHGLIGPNGAGKTTLLNGITRLVPVQQGRISFLDKDITATPTHRIASLGIARTFQNIGLITNLTVIQNVMAGMHSRHPGSILDEVFRIGRRNRNEKWAYEQAREALSFTGMEHVADSEVSGLSYGMRKAVELARAMAVRPEMILLDEPTAGLNSREMAELRDRLVDLRRKTNVTVLVVTHHLEFLSAVADNVTVLDLGKVIATGTPAQIAKDPRVIAAYLGEGEDA